MGGSAAIKQEKESLTTSEEKKEKTKHYSLADGQIK